MEFTKAFSDALVRLIHSEADRPLVAEDYREICTLLKVSKIYYDMDLGGDQRYRDQRTKKLVMADVEQADKIILYDDGRETGMTLVYPYYYDGAEYVHAYIEFWEGVNKEELDLGLYQFMADVIYLLVSRQNMRRMLDFAEVTDAQSGIPNVVYLGKRYEVVTRVTPPEDLLLLYINLQNFKYINEAAGAKSGDEAIIWYSRNLLSFVAEDEAVCRMGGDNFVMFIHKEHLDTVLKKLSSVTVSHLAAAPSQSFEISAWVGISECKPGEPHPLGVRLEEAATACSIGKNVLKKTVVVFSEDLRKMMGRGREVIAMFHSAVRNREFTPFFQAKVDMRTGKLVGFEALCRWIHDGQFIYPDQFVPVLDREGFIHELDMAIFQETCRAIRQWKDMGLKVPCISSNFSRKNLFVPNIEDKIVQTIQKYGLDPEDIEIEITESVKESEYNRLIEFIRRLRSEGLHIAVDDFGTGYSSLSLIHNIDADVIKIDKSFIDELGANQKSSFLIETIVNIAQRLKMTIVAEGVETAEQGRALLDLGCYCAQGFYYSKPVDFEAATDIIRNPEFQPMP